MSIDPNKSKIFHEKMESNKWYDLESLKKNPNCLSEVKEAKKFFKGYFALPKEELEKIINDKGFVHYFPWNIEIITNSDGKKRGKHKKNGKDYNYKLGLPLTSETFPEYMEEVEDLEKEVEGQRENNEKCSKNNPCQSCKDELKQKLSECKDWEVKRKKYIQSWFPFHDEEGNKIKYSETGGYNICSCSFEISNSYGDTNPNNHNCSNNNNQHTERERERERERESKITLAKSKFAENSAKKGNILYFFSLKSSVFSKFSCLLIPEESG